MPPKQGPQVNELTEKNVAVLRAALCCVDEFKPNWALALHKFGVGKGGHGYVSHSLYSDVLFEEQLTHFLAQSPRFQARPG